MSFAIEGTDLHKTFVKRRSIRQLLTRPLGRAERVEALRGVDVRIAEGEVFGLLGPNGAGKTTLLKIFSCLVLPDRGRALVAGEDTIHERRVKPKIGLVHSDERSFYWRLSARENLRFFSRLYDVPSRRIESRIDELLERLNLSAAADRPFSGFSSGMKQRVAIARALLHDPPILLMDEPTRSLDPANARSLRRFIHDELSLRDRKTIVLATHNLREAEQLAERVAILARGRVRQVGPVAEVRRWGMDERRYRLELDVFEGGLELPGRIESDRTHDGRRVLSLLLDDHTGLDEVFRPLVAAGIRVHACDRVDSDLEEAFERILEGEIETQA